LEGDEKTNCQLYYQPTQDPGTVPAAFSLVGAQFVHLRNIGLYASNQYPPMAIVACGGQPGSDGNNIFENTSIRGYANVAMMYSIAAPHTTLSDTYFWLNGGTAQAIVYTSSSDDFGICPGCQSGANVDITVVRNDLNVASNNAVSGIVTKTAGSLTGDQHFSDNYIGLNYVQGSAGYEILSGSSGVTGAETNITISNTRIENGSYGVLFRKDQEQTISNVSVDNITWSTSQSDTAPLFLAYSDDGLSLTGLDMAHNNATVYQMSTPQSSFYQLSAGNLDETYGVISIRSQASGNIFSMRGAASISFPANATGNLLYANGTLTTH
jgi:hypothetical protein